MRRVAAFVCIAAASLPSAARAPARPNPPLRIAFVAGGDGYLYTADVATRHLTRLTRGGNWGAEDVAWSPTGRDIAVLSGHAGANYAESVVLRDSRGGHRRRVALLKEEQSSIRWRLSGPLEVVQLRPFHKMRVTTVSLSRPRNPTVRVEPEGVLSPDGRWLATVRGVPTREDVQIYVERSDGMHAVNVSRSRSVGPGHVVESAPSWSPDSSRLAFVIDRGHGTSVWTMNLDGSQKRRIARAPRIDAGPEWSPDGHWLAYSADVDEDGLDEVYAARIDGGRPHKLAELEYIHALEWQPSGLRPAPSHAAAPVAEPRRPVRTYTYELKKGRGRLVDARRLFSFASDAAEPQLSDLSPGGRTVSLYQSGWLALLDLRSDRLVRLERPPPLGYAPPALFSPDGRFLLYSRRRSLVVRDLVRGNIAEIAHTPADAYYWLRDGRVVFLDRSGRLQIARPGALPRPFARLPRISRFAVTADGRRVLYDRHCETFLLDRRVGRRRRLTGHFFVPFGAWAPNGSYFVLEAWENCNRRTDEIWAYHSGDRIYYGNGLELGISTGRDATWSHDSKLVFAYPQVTGSAVGGLNSVVAIEPRRRRESVLLPMGNAYSQAFLGPGGWVVFSKYDHPGRVSDGDTSGGVFVARLTGLVAR